MDASTPIAARPDATSPSELTDAAPPVDAARPTGDASPPIPAADAGVVHDTRFLHNTNPLFRQHEDQTQADLNAMGGFLHEDFSVEAGPDNGPGPGGQGQFRINCQWSHFAWDDPIVFPGQPGASHLHMFWGNTLAHAYTRYNRPYDATDPHDLMEHGGSTCQGFELNRSAYWIPAMVDTSDPDEHQVVIPTSILLYYKSYRPAEVNPLPEGVEFLAGNIDEDGQMRFRFDVGGSALKWQCETSGHVRYNTQSTIPTDCGPGDRILAVVPFPQCLAVDDSGAPVLRSENHVSHAVTVENTLACPSSHPYRVPQISYLIYWTNGTDGAGAGVENWRLSSDHETETGLHPGGSLHGDWFGGWNESTIDYWIQGCFDPEGVNSGPRNCSLGQTGDNGSGRAFRRVSRLNNYEGPFYFPLVDNPNRDDMTQHMH